MREICDTSSWASTVAIIWKKYLEPRLLETSLRDLYSIPGCWGCPGIPGFLEILGLPPQFLGKLRLLRLPKSSLKFAKDTWDLPQVGWGCPQISWASLRHPWGSLRQPGHPWCIPGAAWGIPGTSLVQPEAAWASLGHTENSYKRILTLIGSCILLVYSYSY